MLISFAPYKLSDTPSGLSQQGVCGKCRSASLNLCFSGSSYHVVVDSKEAFSLDRSNSRHLPRGKFLIRGLREHPYSLSTNPSLFSLRTSGRRTVASFQQAKMLLAELQSGLRQ